MSKKRRVPSELPSAEQVLNQLKAAPLVDLRGVLSESGVGGGMSGGEKLWTLIFTLESWRAGSGPIHQKPLVVRRPGVRDIEKYRERIPMNTVVRFRARVVEKSGWNRPDALLARIVGPDESDAELNAEVQRLQEPVTFTDDVLGEFTLNRGMNRYETDIKWNRREVELALDGDTPSQIKRALKVAYTLWQAPKSWHEKVLACATKELLPIKNSNWLGEEERQFTAKQFQSRLSLNSITVFPNGSFDFWFDDGDLFFGHVIQVCCSLRRGAYAALFHG